MANECHPAYEPGQHLTGFNDSGATIEGKRFVMLDTSKTPWNPVGLKATAAPNVIPIKRATAGARVLGVMQADTPDEKIGTIIRVPGIVIPITSGAAITHGAMVASDADGKAITVATTAIPAGMALTTVGAADLDVFVMLFLVGIGAAA